jgi:membrane dipeptidase
MSRRSVAVALGLAALCARSPSLRAEPVFPIVDLHVDLPWQVHLRGRSLELDKGHATRTALEAGHVAGIVLPLYLPPKQSTPDDLEAMAKTVERLAWSPPFAPLPSGDGPAGPPRVRAWMSIEGATALAGDPASIEPWVRRGVRLVGLAHGQDNALAGSATGKKRLGMTDAGRDMARRAIAAGALLDVSHLSDAAFDDALALSRDAGVPLVATHSNSRRVADHPRNLTDAQLEAIGATGGVVGLNLHGPYVTTKGDPDMAAVIAQADRLVAKAGEDHVAIGSDFDGGTQPPRDLADPSRFPALARALLDHGWSEARVRKVFAENALRVLDGRRPEPLARKPGRIRKGPIKK